VAVQVADRAGNTFVATQRVTLDRTGPSIAPTIMAPNNGTLYDVGTKIGFSWLASDLNGISSTSGTLDGGTISSAPLDVDLLTAGTHTVVITAKDRAGNSTTISLTFQVHATAQGLINAINDGATRGWVTASEAAYLVSQAQQIIKGFQSNVSSGKTKIKQFISAVQYPPAGSLTAAFQSLLLNWANDLYNRS
jgi:hypothetical protein